VNIIRTADGRVSKTMLLGIIFAAFTLLRVALPFVGFDEFVPSDELVVVVDALAAILVLILRHLTKEPMA